MKYQSAGRNFTPVSVRLIYALRNKIINLI